MNIFLAFVALWHSIWFSPQTIIIKHHSGGSSTPTLLGNLGYAASGSNSSSINTTGAKLFAVLTTCYTANLNPTTPSDSSANTYIGLTYYGGTFSGRNLKLWYVLNPTTNAATTWHRNQTGCTNGWDAVQVFSKVSAIDSGTDTGNATSAGTTITTASMTTALPGELIIAGMAGFGNPSSPTVSSTPALSPTAIAVTNNTISGATSDGAMAWGIYQSAAGLTTTWTLIGGLSSTAAAQVAFKP